MSPCVTCSARQAARRPLPSLAAPPAVRPTHLSRRTMAASRLHRKRGNPAHLLIALLGVGIFQELHQALSVSGGTCPGVRGQHARRPRPHAGQATGPRCLLLSRGDVGCTAPRLATAALRPLELPSDCCYRYLDAVLRKGAEGGGTTVQYYYTCSLNRLGGATLSASHRTPCRQHRSVFWPNGQFSWLSRRKCDPLPVLCGSIQGATFQKLGQEK
jgi:hypothetical protein